ncbi:MAG: FecR family protein [Steroidobacteraceae bacterium]
MTGGEKRLAKDSASTRAAADWLERFESVAEEPPLSPQEWASWDAFAADDRNLAAFNRLATVRAQMHRTRPPSWPTQTELFADNSDNPRWGSNPTAHASGVPARWRPRLAPGRIGHWAVAVAAAIVPLTLLFLLLRSEIFGAQFGAAPHFAAAWSTTTGENRKVSLADGSTITLGARSAVSVAYARTAREVELTSGEAFFQVTHDKSRPFRVRAGAGTVTALGTAFNVSRTSEHVIVTVSDGAVLIAPAAPMRDSSQAATVSADSAQWAPVRVELGQQVSYQAEGNSASTVAQADPQSETAWSHGGALVYRRRPLLEVLDDVRRYTDAEITIIGDLGSLPPYSGTVSEHHVRAWLHALPEIYSVEVSEQDVSHITIRSRSELSARPANK